MTEDYNTYFKELELSSTLCSRIDKLIKLAHDYYSMDFPDIFICDFLNEEGIRQYESLWLFNNDYSVEFESFEVKMSFDIAPIKKCMVRVETITENFDDFEIVKNSIMAVDYNDCNDLTGQLRAAGINCKYLLEIVKKYLLPNLVH